MSHALDVSLRVQSYAAAAAAAMCRKPTDDNTAEFWRMIALRNAVCRLLSPVDATRWDELLWPMMPDPVRVASGRKPIGNEYLHLAPGGCC